MNLFWATRRLTEAREDHLTEFFAAALSHAPSFRQAYADLVLRDFAARAGWSSPVIEVVETQREYPGTGCRPDMILRLANGKVVACEHKLEALETLGADDDRGQLARYLELPIDALVYVRRSWLPPDRAVISNPKYVRASNREHFLWSDFFAFLGPDQHVLVDWLREGFEWLGYTPPNPNVGELTLLPNGETRAAMVDFAKLWDPVKTAVARLGWTVQTGSLIQLYLVRHPTSPAAQVFISPESRGEFLIRFTPVEEARVEELLALATSAAAKLTQRTTVKVATGSLKSNRVKVVDVRATRNAVLGDDETTVEQLQTRMLRFVEPLVAAVSSPRSSAYRVREETHQ
jgi:hypothetical protein